MNAKGWAPLFHLGKLQAPLSSSTELARWAKEDAPSLAAIGYAREVVEMSIRIQCRDPRIRYLSAFDHLLLDQISTESPVKLLASLASLNLEISRLGLDDRVDVTSIVLPLLRREGGN